MMLMMMTMMMGAPITSLAASLTVLSKTLTPGRESRVFLIADWHLANVIYITPYALKALSSQKENNNKNVRKAAAKCCSSSQVLKDTRNCWGKKTFVYIYLTLYLKDIFVTFCGTSPPSPN